MFVALILKCPQFHLCVLTCHNIQRIPIMSKTDLCHAVPLLVFDANIENFVDVWNQTLDLGIGKVDVSHDQ
jgi:hypothetical protein